MTTRVSIGAIFPQTELGTDPAVIRQYVSAIDELGFDHLLIYDHVLGAAPRHRSRVDISRPLTETFVFFGYVAALAPRLELATSVLVLPQRQTALVAKQAAVVDVLTAGKLRLAIGSGWNELEYCAMNGDWQRRGAMLDEQVELLRRLWSEPIVDFDGDFHTVDGLGLNPMPVQRPIPIWMGGGADVMLRRIGRCADGFMPLPFNDEQRDEQVSTVRKYAAEAGRDPSQIGLEGRIDYGGRSRPPLVPAAARPPGEIVEEVRHWADLGATHLHVDTRRSDLVGVDAHVRALETMLDLVGEALDRPEQVHQQTGGSPLTRTRTEEQE